MIPTLDITAWRTIYTMYSQVSDAVLNNLWVGVETTTPAMILAYSQSKINYYYYLVLAHYAEMWLTQQNGRVVAATQKDTATTFESLGSPTLQWWASTQWGAQIAQLIRQRGGATWVA